MTPHPRMRFQDVLLEGYRFIREKEDDAEGTWEQRVARRYYDKLFKARSAPPPRPGSPML